MQEGERMVNFVCVLSLEGSNEWKAAKQKTQVLFEGENWDTLNSILTKCLLFKVKLPKLQLVKFGVSSKVQEKKNSVQFTALNLMSKFLSYFQFSIFQLSTQGQWKVSSLSNASDEKSEMKKNGQKFLCPNTKSVFIGSPPKK